MSKATPDGAAKSAYESIAPLYDDFTAHHDYELWFGELLPQLRRDGLTGDRLLDVACGTGKSFLPMLARGWRVTACDISPAMLRLAQAKAEDAVQLSVADMRQLPVFGEFDLVWALNDALNYLLNAEDLCCALRSMRTNLAASGLLLFDVNTLASYNTFFSQTHSVESEGRRLIWRGQASGDVAPGSICEALFEVETTTDEPDHDAAHVHRQRHHPEAVVLSALSRAELECLGVFGHGYDAVLEQPLDEARHTKAIYIARRDEAWPHAASP